MVDGRNEKGQFLQGQSGNPAGRPKGVKNQITILKQSLELALRNKSAEHMEAVLDVAIKKALRGDNQMIKLLVEQHMTKGSADEREATEKVSITIGTHGQPTKEEKVVINEEEYNVESIETDAIGSTVVPDADECEGDSLSGAIQSEAS
jgi:hypothetical protein